MGNIKLSEDKHIFGNLTTKDVVLFEIDILGDSVDMDFDYIDYHCNACTKGVYDRAKRKITGTLNLSQVGVVGNKEVINKYVTIYFDPDVREFISDDDGKRIVNANKRKLKYLITGIVEYVA